MHPVRKKWLDIFTPLTPLMLDADERTFDAYCALHRHAMAQIREAEKMPDLSAMKPLSNLPAMCGTQ